MTNHLENVIGPLESNHFRSSMAFRSTYVFKRSSIKITITNLYYYRKVFHQFEDIKFKHRLSVPLQIVC